MGWLVWGPLGPANGSTAELDAVGAKGEAVHPAAISPSKIELADAPKATELSQNAPASEPVVLEIPDRSARRMIYLSALLVALAVMLGWHCSELLREKRARNTAMVGSVLEKESNSTELASMVRRALVPKFAEWLNTHGVRQLVAQRDGLRSTQQFADMELAKLEQMLIEIHGPLEERIRGYELRISELEQALKARGVEGRELIETMIRFTRQKLEAERQATQAAAL